MHRKVISLSPAHPRACPSSGLFIVILPGPSLSNSLTVFIWGLGGVSSFSYASLIQHYTSSFLLLNLNLNTLSVIPRSASYLSDQHEQIQRLQTGRRTSDHARHNCRTGVSDTPLFRALHERLRKCFHLQRHTPKSVRRGRILPWLTSQPSIFLVRRRQIANSLVAKPELAAFRPLELRIGISRLKHRRAATSFRRLG